jgi:hypothetical protein
MSNPQRVAALLLLVAGLSSPGWMAPARAQAPRPGEKPSLAQAERNAVELQQGMTLDAVRHLLGKPKRTALKTAMSYGGGPAQDALHWTYDWGPGRTLQVVFAAKAPEQWQVNSWEWSTY